MQWLGLGPLKDLTGEDGVTPALPFSTLTEMWYGVFLWALVSSVFFHVPAGLLALFTLRHHKYGRFMSVGILMMGIVGPISAGVLTSMLAFKYQSKAWNVVGHLILEIRVDWGGWEVSSVGECLPSEHKALGLVSSTGRGKKCVYVCVACVHTHNEF